MMVGWAMIFFGDPLAAMAMIALAGGLPCAFMLDAWIDALDRGGSPGGNEGET